MSRHVLVTGAAGFIGSHLTDALLANGDRLTLLDKRPLPGAVRGDIRDPDALTGVEGLKDVDAIVHLAGLAGVRPSIADPLEYDSVNIAGTIQMLEYARQRGVKQFVFASSSSVYGNVAHGGPFREDVDEPRPISPYGLSKLAAEHIGRIYSDLYGIRFIALRLFTVYGPRQRPDLAIHTFATKMLAGDMIPFYGDGSTGRDYTFVEDTVGGIMAAIDYRDTMFEAVNLGCGSPVTLMGMTTILEAALGVPAKRHRMPGQPGDVSYTWADISKARTLFRYEPRVDFQTGVRQYVDWLRRKVAA